MEQAALALHQAGQAGRASAGDQGIPFPVTELPTGGHRGRPHFDADPIGNLGLTLLPGEAFWLPPSVGSPEAEDELLTVRGLRMIDVGVDRLMADGQTGMFEPNPSRDNLGGPALMELGLHVGPNLLLLEAKPLAGLSLPLHGPILSAVGQVAVVGRGSVPAQLSGERAGRPVQGPGNLTQALPVTTHFENLISFHQG